MARIQCSGGISLDGDHRAWLVADPGDEVDDWRPLAGAPVVVGRAGASRRDIERARRKAGRLVATGGPLVAAAGIDVGGGLRSARLDGGGEARRDAVLAAVELLGIAGLDRIGPRDATLVALFGVRTTKRVAAAALDALARGSFPALRLAVGASDLLGPEQLEQVLALSDTLPPGVDPVPRPNTALLGEQLGVVVGPFTSRRRLELIRSLWDDVVSWQRSEEMRARARRRRFSPARLTAWEREIAHQNDLWWRAQSRPQIGEEPGVTAMLTWMPPPPVCWEALFRAFQEAIAATAVLRTALAAESQPVDTAVLAHLDQLAFAATAHVGDLEERVEAVRGLRPRGCAASDRAASLVAAVLVGSDPGVPDRFVEVGDLRVDRRQLASSLRSQLKDACELSRAVLRSTLAVFVAIDDLELPQVPSVAQWRAVAGYSAVRDPRLWAHQGIGTGERLSLAERLADGGPEPATVERLGDGLWLADLADVVAAWYGHERAAIAWFGVDSVDVDPPVAAADPRSPLLESVPLAVAGAAQLVAVGATPPKRPASWEALASGLVASAEALGLTDEFAVDAEVAGWDRRELPGRTDLVIEVARSARQLADWGNYMGNCIATYADLADEKYALLALRDASGKLFANVAILRSGERWRLREAFARFNEPLPDDVEDVIRWWVDQLTVRAGAGPARRAAVASRPPQRSRRRRRVPARERLARVTADLAAAVGDVRSDGQVGSAEAVLRPIASALGWSGDDDGLSLFVAIARPRRPGPLAAAVAGALENGCQLAELWHATTVRPLAAAVAGLDGGEPDLRRILDTTVPPSLRPALRDPQVWSARVVDLSGRRVREALGLLLRDADPHLDAAVTPGVHLGFLTASVLAMTATAWDRPSTSLPIDADGSVPGRPRSSVLDVAGPWVQACDGAVELGAARPRVEQVLWDGAGRDLVVPAPWVASGGWTALWARAHRTTR